MEPAKYKALMDGRYYRNNAYHAVIDPETDSTSGNHHVINAIHYTILKRYNLLNDGDRETANEFIHACMEGFGIYNRAPDKFDHQAHDDYLGIAVTSKLLNLYHRLIIANTPYYYFDNTEETPKVELKNWHGRFPWAVYTYKVAADQNPGVFNRLIFCGYLVMDLFRKDLTDTSGRILRWLQIQNAKGESKVVDFFINLWENNLRKKYTGGMGEVMAIYYGADHPFAEILRDQV